MTTIEPLYISYAKQMLGVDRIPDSLREKLAIAEEMVQKVKPCGCLSSTQTIASIILMWELEQIVRKYTIEPQDFSNGNVIDIDGDQ